MAEDRRDEGKQDPGTGGPEQFRRNARTRRFRGPRREQAPGKAKNGQGDVPAPVPRKDAPLCPLCGKAVYDLSNAVADASGLPSHFECILERVQAAETLAAGEKIVYIGAGAFAVVEYTDKAEHRFVVKRRIQWEKEGEKRDWRRGISSGIATI